MKLRGLALIIAFGACGKSKGECKTEAAELGQFLADANEGPSVLLAPGLNLVSRPELPHPPVDYAPTAAVMPAGFVFDGQKVDAAGLAERLAAQSAKLHEDIDRGRVPRKHPPNPRKLFVEIDAAAPWSAVVDAMQAAAAAKFDQPVLVFSRPQPKQPPPPSSADAELDAIEADGNGATKLAGLVTKAIKGCSMLKKAFGSVGSDEGEDKAKVLIAAIEPSLIDCGCDVDLPVLRTAMWRIVSSPHPTTSITVTMTEHGEEIAFPATTPWSDASKRFTATTKAVRLVVR